MRILFGKTFGLGNAVMAIPAIKALKLMGYKVDLLIGLYKDDAGAFDVFKYIKNKYIDNIYTTRCPLHVEYDIAIMSIPFDGRWMNGTHFNAKKVIDGRTRPDPSTIGLTSWKKHEIEYQMDNIYSLGYIGDIPSTSFYEFEKQDISIKRVYFGVGYKKDDEEFWKVKHFGNENFYRLAESLFDKYNDLEIISTGDILDWRMSLQPIKENLYTGYTKRFNADFTSLDTAFDKLSLCDLYVGNDTGMMHVAASMGIKCIVPFFLENSIIKSRPWGNNHIIVDALKEKDYYSVIYNSICEYYNE